MRLIVILVVVLAGLMAQGHTAWAAQESTTATPADYECDLGLARCAPLGGQQEKYHRCLKLICVPEKDKKASPEDTQGKKDKKDDKKSKKNPEEIPENLPNIGPAAEQKAGKSLKGRTCEVGLRRCNPLRELGLRYWVCMDETCNDKKLSKLDPFCKKGKGQCFRKLDKYKECVDLICKRENPNCPEGVKACGLPLANYWDCVSGVCLGNVDKYKDPSVEKKARGEADFEKTITPEGTQRRIYRIGDEATPLLGVAKEHQLPPPGVSQESWNSWYIPQEMVVDNNLINRIECRIRTSSIICSDNHAGSCYCSDGSLPVFKSTIRDKGYQEAFGMKLKPQ